MDPIMRYPRTTLYVLSAVLMAVVATSAPVRAEEPLSRGKRWVRNHPLTTMALTMVPNLFEPDVYGRANLNTVLCWKTRPALLSKAVAAKMPWHLHVYPHKDGLTEELKASLTKIHDDHPGQTGWMVWDEPKRSQMFIAARTMRWLRDTWPDELVYSNAYPMGATAERYYGGPVPEGGYSYEDYLRDFATIMDSDVVMFDAYPFKEGGRTLNLFPTLMTARKIGKERGVPYWAFVQSHSDPRRSYRMPSESDVRMQVFQHLAAGFTGIAYFTWEDQQGPAIVHETGRLRPIYYDVARLNREAVHVGQALRFLESTEVRYVPCRGNPVPEAVTAWKLGDGIEAIRAITIEDDGPAAWKDVLVGFFTDDDGRDYFMLTNLWHGMDATAADRALTVTVTLDPKVKVVGRLSRKTGDPEMLAVTDGRLRITLPGGTGDLLRLGDAEFPGLGSEPR